MKRMLKTFQFLMVVLAMSTSVGCSLLYELQPHRLQRLNQGEGMSREAYFSVSDSGLKKLEQKDPFIQTETESN